MTKLNLDQFDEKTAALTDTERGRLLLAMVRYWERGQEPDVNLMENDRFLWPCFKVEIDLAKAVEDAVERETASLRERRSEAGKKGMARRWSTETEKAETASSSADISNDNNGITDDNKIDCVIPCYNGENFVISGPVSEEKEKRTKKEKEGESGEKDSSPPPNPPELASPMGFLQFWAAYPRKDAKQDALRAWKQLRPEAETLQKILRAIQDQRASPQWQKDGGQFIPLPASWLRGRRWEDQGTGQTPGKTVGAQQYEQRPYTAAQMDSIGDDLLAEARKKREATG